MSFLKSSFLRLLLIGIAVSPVYVAGVVTVGFSPLHTLLLSVFLVFISTVPHMAGPKQERESAAAEIAGLWRSSAALRESVFIACGGTLLLDLSMVLLGRELRSQTITVFGTMALTAGSVGLLWALALLSRATRQSAARARRHAGVLVLCLYFFAVIAGAAYLGLVSRQSSEQRREDENARHNRALEYTKQLPR